MIETLSQLLGYLNALTPLGLAGGLAYIVYLLVGKRGPINSISDNHLSSLPDMVATLERIEKALCEIRDGISYLKGRVNGR